MLGEAEGVYVGSFYVCSSSESTQDSPSKFLKQYKKRETHCETKTSK